MIEKLKFKEISIGECSLFIELTTGNKLEVSFLEIKRINLSIYKFPFWYFLLVGLLFVASCLFIQILNLDSFYHFPLLIGFGFFINYFVAKKYLLKVSLKNGNFYFKIIPLHLKTENLILVNQVKEEVFKYKTAN